MVEVKDGGSEGWRRVEVKKQKDVFLNSMTKQVRYLMLYKYFSATVTQDVFAKVMCDCNFCAHALTFLIGLISRLKYFLRHVTPIAGPG